MSKNWISTKIPRALNDKIDEILEDSTYLSKTSLIAEAIREKLEKLESQKPKAEGVS